MSLTGRSKKTDVKKYSHYSTEEERWSNYRLDLELRFSQQTAWEIMEDLFTAIRYADNTDKPDVTLHLFQFKEDK